MKRSVLKSFIPLTAATLAVVAVVELVGLHASQATAPAAQSSVDRAPVDRALLDRYCVTCHNERLKTAGLTLDKVDLTRIGVHAATLEKVVRKLRSGQMPPEGRPRPEKPDVDKFVTSLETALDRRERAEPGPGRHAPAEPRRVRQRHPRPAGARHRSRAAAGRQSRAGLRQQRRCALGHARRWSSLHVGGHQDQPARGRRASQRPASSDLPSGRFAARTRG